MCKLTVIQLDKNSFDMLVLLTDYVTTAERSLAYKYSKVAVNAFKPTFTQKSL